MSEVSALEVTGLRKSFTLRNRDELIAVGGVTFHVGSGEAVGIVGESGSGKTTLARLIIGLERPTAGTIRVAGHDRSGPARGHGERLARAKELQIVFQDPYTSLDSRQTARACVIEALRLHTRLTHAACASRAGDLLAQVGLPERAVDQRPARLSGGQRQRIAIARALAVEPAVLVLDEAVSALDVSVQAQILNLLEDIRARTGTSLLFISHDLGVVQHVTERALVMRHGVVVEQGPTSLLLDKPRHPYTRALVSSIPRRGWRPARLDRSTFDASPTANPDTTTA